MSMGYGAGFTLKVKEEVLEKLVPEQIKTFLNQMEEADFSTTDFLTAIEEIKINEDNWENALDTLIEEMESEDVNENIKVAENAVKAWIDLRNSFEKATGFPLYMGYHNSEEYGSEYDEVEGIYFSLNFNDVYEETESMKKAKEKGMDYDMSFFVTYG